MRSGGIRYVGRLVPRVVISMEDPMADADWEGRRPFRSVAPQPLQIVGDDLFVTSVDRIRTGIESGVANAVLIKFNQVGTATEALDPADSIRRLDSSNLGTFGQNGGRIYHAPSC